MDLTSAPFSQSLCGPHDENLATRIARREPDAMDELFDRFGKRVWSFVASLIRDTAIVEDIVQETFLHVWNRMPAFEAGKSSLAAWLLAVAHERVLERTRSTVAASGSLPVHPSLFTEFKREVFSKERSRALSAAFEKLEPKERAVFDIAWREGLSISQISARMDEPADSVNLWLRSAFTSLSKLPESR